MAADRPTRSQRAVERCDACGIAVVSLGGGLWQAFEAGSAEFLCRGRPITCLRCQGDPGPYCGGCASTGHVLGGHEPAPIAIGWPEPRVPPEAIVTPLPRLPFAPP